ncbi:excisionase family DNA binding protein [Xylanimonas ulmi]|uniref:Excisionase family DNA binding protein n=2 Tax=Xylanimonas ulmi TaxID=228973 RepID=A0A4Q7M3W1_9MICO|nr:excisionase family DNA binding protein [Xylanibacterium ulmi]
MVAVIAHDGRLDGMATHAIRASLDPARPGVRSAARRLAAHLDDDSEVGNAVRSMLDDVAHGTRVVVLRADDEVTPAKAAEMIGVTRQYVDRLCEDGALAFRRLPGSRHRRIRVQDVLDVVGEREARRAGGDALRAAITDAGLDEE